jgi:S-adenosylmethionine decarboxylase
VALAQCESAGLMVVSSHWHRFHSDQSPDTEQNGFTGVLLLAESHLAIHTWPELHGVTLDVYVCNYGQNNSEKAEHLMRGMLAFFAATEVKLNRLQRG